MNVSQRGLLGANGCKSLSRYRSDVLVSLLPVSAKCANEFVCSNQGLTVPISSESPHHSTSIHRMIKYYSLVPAFSQNPKIWGQRWLYEQPNKLLPLNALKLSHAMQVYSELSVVTFLRRCSWCWRRRRWQWTWQAGYSWCFHYRISAAWQQKRTISESCCHGFAWCSLWVFGLWRGDRTIYEWWRMWNTEFSNTHRTVATGNWPVITINWAKLIHLSQNLVNAICSIVRTWVHFSSVTIELL